MPAVKSEIDAVGIQSIATTMILQALIGRLLSNGLLDAHDLSEMRAYGMQFAGDLAERVGPVHKAEAARLSEVLSVWWDQINCP